MSCPVCGTVPVPGARFCHNCGAALPAAATLPATERRVVTVLFGDLSDFTAWSEGVDPERVGAVTDRVLAALAGAVKTFGGHVDKLTGDGIMAVFGAPVAHEDDAERAVRAALAMQRAVRRVLDDERGGGAPVGLRIGVNTGVVVAGMQAALEYTVIGDTVNTAARLADAATIGTVFAGAATSAATRRVAAWRRLLPLRLKGKRDPVDAYELLGLLDAPGTRSGIGDEAPFVGRETELGLVTSRLAEAVDRAEPRVLVFTAEAGVGKTRFAAEAGRLAAGYDRGTGGGARVLSVRCAAYGERRRLAPLADLVRAAIGLATDNGSTRLVAEERLRRVAQLVQRRTGTAPRLQPDLLLSLLGYPEPAVVADPGVGRANGERAEADTVAIPGAVAELLSALAREAPLVVVVDDLHNATRATVDALGTTLNRLVGPVLVVLLGRPELARGPGALTRLADAEVHGLPALRGAESARLLTSYLGGGRLPQADEDRLLATAQGNPFYLAELVTLLMERGLLTPAPLRGRRNEFGRGEGDRAWRLAPDSLGGKLLSRDLAAVLAARIDALPGDARAVLRDAAVVGDTVPTAALEALRERRGAPDARPAAVAAVELERAVDELLHRRMLLRVRNGYAFATPLMREAAYAGVGKGDLAERHARLARWASGLTIPPPQPGESGLRDRALVAGVAWTIETVDGFIADQTERAASLADAVRLRPDAEARTVVPLGVGALLRLARRTSSAGEPGQAAVFAERAMNLAGGSLPPADRLVHARSLLQLGRSAEALNEAEKICTDATDDPASRARALLLVGRAHRALGDPGRAERVWGDALAVATGRDLVHERTEALRRLGMADYLAGRLAEAAERFEQALALSEAAGDRHGMAWSLQNLTWVTTTRGDFAATDQALAKATRLFAELHDVTGRAWLRGATAFARILAGRLAEARRMASVFLPFGERVGERWAVGTLRAVDAYAAAELGDLASADREARRAFRDFAEIDDDWGRGFALVVRGAVARGLGEHNHAMDLLTDACGLGEVTGHPLLIMMARTVRGFVSLDQGDAAGAEADARIALAVAEPHAALEAAQVGPRALLGCAMLGHGDTTSAIKLLGEAAGAAAIAGTSLRACAEEGQSMLYPRRHALAVYAHALLVDGQVEAAVEAAQRAVELPAEDVRSRVVAQRELARTLAAAGRLDEARAAAEGAVRDAYATQQASERPEADAMLAKLS